MHGSGGIPPGHGAAKRPREQASCAVAAALLLGSCGDLGFTAEVIGRRVYEPPAVYHAWWAATETCSGRQARFERVSWYLAAGISGDGHLGRARWSPPHEIIIVAGYEHDERTVRHEMLHDLLNGDRVHERVEWITCDLLPE